jgi:hypothetical protein
MPDTAKGRVLQVRFDFTCCKYYKIPSTLLAPAAAEINDIEKVKWT